MEYREFPDPDHLLLPNDRRTIWVTPDTWECPVGCPPTTPEFPADGDGGAPTSMDWIPGDGPDGRCRTCGIKVRLARWRESVPSPEEQH